MSTRFCVIPLVVLAFLACGSEVDSVRAAEVAEQTPSAVEGEANVSSSVSTSFAPWAPGAQQHAAGEIPEPSIIGVPPYPGAMIVWAVTTKGEQYLPHINLISTDTPEKVLEFYRSELEPEGWKWDENMEVLYKGKSEALMQGRTPFIKVTKVNPVSFDLASIDKSTVEKAQTYFQIVYDPDA